MESIATALVTNKVKGLTKDLENAVGLNEDDRQNEAAAERSKFVEERRRQRLIEERRKERDERHKERESERDQIRSKYQIPPRGAANRSSNSSSTKNQASSDEDKKCTIS